ARRRGRPAAARPARRSPHRPADLSRLAHAADRPLGRQRAVRSAAGIPRADRARSVSRSVVAALCERNALSAVEGGAIMSSRLPPVPVIGLVGVEAPSRLKALVNLGATSFLRKPVHGGAVYTSLFMGINQFLLRAEMYERLQDLEERRRGRRAVIRAVILLM